MKYKIIYSERKTIGISVKNGEVILKAPHKTPRTIISDVLKKHEEWIIKAIEKEKIRNLAHPEPSAEEIKILKKKAKIYFTEKCEYFAKLMNAKYSKITITSAKTRFGSCSSKKSISFSYRLMLYPEEAREYVIVHELAHLFHMNHSRAFYSAIEKYMPDYKERKKLLKY